MTFKDSELHVVEILLFLLGVLDPLFDLGVVDLRHNPSLFQTIAKKPARNFLHFMFAVELDRHTLVSPRLSAARRTSAGHSETRFLGARHFGSGFLSAGGAVVAPVPNWSARRRLRERIFACRVVTPLQDGARSTPYLGYPK